MSEVLHAKRMILNAKKELTAEEQKEKESIEQYYWDIPMTDWEKLDAMMRYNAKRARFESKKPKDVDDLLPLPF